MRVHPTGQLRSHGLISRHCVRGGVSIPMDHVGLQRFGYRGHDYGWVAVFDAEPAPSFTELCVERL